MVPIPSFTITGVDPNPRVWEGDHGAFHIYTVDFRHPDGRAETGQVKQKTTTAPPSIGQVIDGELKLKDGFPPEIKKTFSANGFGGGGKGRTPEEIAQIVRQHSQQMAIYWFEILKRHELLTEEQAAKGPRYVVDLIDFFQRDAEAAKPNV